MKILILALLLGFAQAGIINSGPKRTTIRSTEYEEEILKDGVRSPYQLAIDHDTNTLFFSYTAKTSETFKIAYLSLKTNDYGIVSGIHGGFANAIDTKSHTVYMGGEDGIYTFDYDTKSAKYLNTNINVNIWQMFFKDGLYFTTYPDEKAYFYNNQQVREVADLKERVMEIAIKNDGSYVYSNSSGLFIHKKVTGKVLNIGDYTVNGFTTDIDGNIYFSTPSGIYYINDKTFEIEELAKFDNIYGIAIEGNGNIIYANGDSIVRLKSVKKQDVENIV